MKNPFKNAFFTSKLSNGKLLKKSRSYQITYSSLKYYLFFFTAVFVVVLLQYQFSSLESFFYNARMQFNLFGKGIEKDIVLITLDEESDEFLGEKYPYSYASYQRLTDRLFEQNPRVVAFFVDFTEPFGEEEQYIDDFKKKIDQYLDNGGGLRISSNIDSLGERLPPHALRDIGYSLSTLNVDGNVFSKDKVCRRALLKISGDSSIHLWIANTYRAQQGLYPLSEKNIPGAYYSKDADATFFLFNYFFSTSFEHPEIKTIPFHRVVVGNVSNDFFRNKIVLIGPAYNSRSEDKVVTPLDSQDNSLSLKLAVHANIVRSLLINRGIVEVPKVVSSITALLLAVFLVMSISKLTPTRGLVVVFVTLLTIVVLSFLLFSVLGKWLHMSHMVLTVVLVYYLVLPFKAIAEYQRRYAIQEEAELLKGVESLKQNFLSLMSHDLKTPVAKIAGIADGLLRNYRDNEVLAKGLNAINDSTKELNNFISSILDLTKVESHRWTLNIASKDINSVIEQISEKLIYEAQQNEIIVEKELAPLFPISIDVKLIQRVVSNLVENAIKYSGKGSKIIIRTYDDQSHVYVEISDNGVGIPEKDINHIFDKFYRVKNDANHSIKGSGLGLYLVKYFIELQGGSISVASKIGEGTTFTIKLKNA